MVAQVFEEAVSTSLWYEIEGLSPYVRGACGGWSFAVLALKSVATQPAVLDGEG